jgi:hypothetical protein
VEFQAKVRAGKAGGAWPADRAGVTLHDQGGRAYFEARLALGRRLAGILDDINAVLSLTDVTGLQRQGLVALFDAVCGAERVMSGASPSGARTTGSMSVRELAWAMAEQRLEWEDLDRQLRALATAKGVDGVKKRAELERRKQALGCYHYPWLNPRTVRNAKVWPPEDWDAVWDALENVPGLGTLTLKERSVARGAHPEAARNRMRGRSSGVRKRRR